MVGLTSGAEEVAFRRRGPNLGMYRPIPDLRDFWQGHWGAMPIAESLAKAGTGAVGPIGPSVERFLPRDGPILEAGCGMGIILQGLKARGYDVVGVDYAGGIVADVNATAPDLALEVGDITTLRWDDNTFRGYVSIGVMEHFVEGPQQPLAEAFRVLEPDGIALISVPYKNTLRGRRWRSLDESGSDDLPCGWRFYQDYVDLAHFERQLLDCGFEVVDIHPYALYAALLRDSALLSIARRRGWLRYRARLALRLACDHAPRFIRFRYSHMMMFVVRKPAAVEES